MPSAYTNPVLQGEINSLSEFAMICARAFGATVDMRGEPLSAKVPERFEPNPFYERSLRAARARLAALQRMSPADAQRACQQDHTKRLATWRRSCDQQAVARLRYNTLLAQVQEWEPPTSDHAGLRDFMLAQLRDSLDFDCSGPWPEEYPRQVRWEEWLRRELNAARMSVEFAKEHLADEYSRTHQRNSWFTELRRSLA